MIHQLVLPLPPHGIVRSLSTLYFCMSSLTKPDFLASSMKSESALKPCVRPFMVQAACSTAMNLSLKIRVPGRLAASFLSFDRKPATAWQPSSLKNSYVSSWPSTFSTLAFLMLRSSQRVYAAPEHVAMRTPDLSIASHFWAPEVVG